MIAGDIQIFAHIFFLTIFASWTKIKNNQISAKKNIKVERIYSGHLKTSLEMHGYQICVFHLNKVDGEYWLRLLDAPTDAYAWPGTQLSVLNNDENNIGDDEEIVKRISSRREVSAGNL